MCSGSARLTSFEINVVSKETSRAEPECVGVHPPNWRSSDGPGSGVVVLHTIRSIVFMLNCLPQQVCLELVKFVE